MIPEQWRARVLGAVALVVAAAAISWVVLAVGGVGGDRAAADSRPPAVVGGHLALRPGASLHEFGSVAMPGGRGTCEVFGQLALDRAGERIGSVVDVPGYAASGCRGGLVLQALGPGADPTAPFAGSAAPIDLGSCRPGDVSTVLTEGGLSARATTFACDRGSLHQWTFSDTVVWSLDGGPAVARMVGTARAVPAAGGTDADRHQT